MNLRTTPFCNKEEIMSEQNLPDLNESNQIIKAQPETASNQIAPPSAIINGTLFVSDKVGIGTNSPQSMLHIGDGLPTPPYGGYRPWMVRGTLVSEETDNVFFGLKNEGLDRKDAVIAWGDNPEVVSPDAFRFIFVASQGPADGQEIMRLEAKGTVGVVKVTGDVYANGILLTSSRELKENISELSGSEAVEALKNLNPVKFNFKADSDKNLHIGFIAEDVPKLVATSDRKTLSPMDIVAVLTQALKEQQNTILALAEKVKVLEAKAA
jgi:hypothetical protein